MNTKKTFISAAALILLGMIIWAGQFYWQNLRGVGPAIKPPPQDIAVNGTDLPLQLPDGFSISVFAKDLGGARDIIFDASSRLLVSLTSQGRIVALPDDNVDGMADSVITVADGLNRPHGLAINCQGNAAVQQCFLFVAETNQVSVFDYDQSEARASNKRKIIDLPSSGGHYTRSLLIEPNTDRLLISVGSSCNVCHEDDDRRAKILSANLDGSDLKTFAQGLRNAVFMTAHPQTNEVWATEMGRDFLGDNLPPDEVNIIREGGNYGWPICYGKNIHDTNFDKNTYIRNPCMEPFETPSHIDIPAHSAPLGLDFISQDNSVPASWPQDYWHNLLIAYHGSWNRTEPTGYKVVRFKLNQNGQYLGEEDFITGWLTNDGALGRPVDVEVLPGGIVYISDDKAGVIYKVERIKN